jgi:hypothetical protein
LPDAISTNCSKCTEKQKSGSEKIMHFMWDSYLLTNNCIKYAWKYY